MIIVSPIPSCIRFTAGHQVHWIQWKQALGLPPRGVTLVRLDEIGVIVADDRGPIRLWNHDLRRMAAAMADHEAELDYWQRLGVLRIGTLWFNCSTSKIHAGCSDRWV